MACMLLYINCFTRQITKYERFFLSFFLQFSFVFLTLVIGKFWFFFLSTFIFFFFFFWVNISNWCFFLVYILVLFYFFWLISTLTLFLNLVFYFETLKTLKLTFRPSFVGFEGLLGRKFMQDFKGITTLKSCFWFFTGFFFKKHLLTRFFLL